MKRRELLGAAAFAVSALPFAAMPARAETVAFDYAWLKGQARWRAQQPYVPPAQTVSTRIARLNWDEYQHIRFLPEHALWADDALRFRVQFFHLGLHVLTPVKINLVRDGRARPIAYDARRFDLGESGLEPSLLPPDLGYAGFRIHFHTDFERDVAAFLGASYFRAVGESLQYGLSARGLAIDCGMTRPEEFPAFTEYWLEQPTADSSTLVVNAMLDSPSLAGAYRFEITPGTNLVMRVDAALYPRRAIERLGIAPLTSMFLCAPYDRRVSGDWRPAIHDSDGLAMCTGNGERIWRPLRNPRAVEFNAFQDDAPRGFGLLQRDRDFGHYQDDNAFYDRRPSLWVEPLAGFGKGSVDLLEIPAQYETADNIAAFWSPAQPVQGTNELLFAYRLHWGNAPAPAQQATAYTAMTWSGLGGAPSRAREYFSQRFVVDFSGGVLDMLEPEIKGAPSKVEVVVSASHGSLENISGYRQLIQPGYRAVFDLRPGDFTGPVDLRLYLRLDGNALSETWLYQWTPPPRAPGSTEHAEA